MVPDELTSRIRASDSLPAILWKESHLDKWPVWIIHNVKLALQIIAFFWQMSSTLDISAFLHLKSLFRHLCQIHRAARRA